MHIPQGPTAALDLEPFDEALAAALRPAPEGALLSVNL